MIITVGARGNPSDLPASCSIRYSKIAFLLSLDEAVDITYSFKLAKEAVIKP